jgi:hypothetical protein
MYDRNRKSYFLIFKYVHNACAELLVSERRYDIKAFKGFWEIHVKTRKQYKAVAS